jgi:hypothetical protein
MATSATLQLEQARLRRNVDIVFSCKNVKTLLSGLIGGAREAIMRGQQNWCVAHSRAAIPSTDLHHLAHDHGGRRLETSLGGERSNRRERAHYNPLCRQCPARDHGCGRV